MSSRPAFDIIVNNKPVPVTENRMTGSEILKAAIDAGVEVEPDFQLAELRPNGELKVVGPDDTVTVNKQSRFRAVAPDDNS